MGEAIISRRGGTSGGKAQIIVYVDSAVTVTCGSQSKTASLSSGKYTAVFNVDYGTYTISAYYSGQTATTTLSVTILQQYEVTLANGHTYTVCVDMSVSDPTSACTYEDDAAGLTPLSVSSSGTPSYGSWADFVNKVAKPCLYNNGTVTYLNPNNYAQTAAGATADITSGSAGDVMIEFSKKWYKFAISGNYLRFSVADYDRSSDGFITTAFTSEDGNGSAVDAFYYGAYEGFNSSNKIRSLSGKTPTVNISWTNSLSYCAATGSKYTMEPFIKRMYILGLLMLVTKSRDGQATIGYGRVKSNSSAINTGTMNTKGLFYGRRDVDTEGCKVFGIENFWGNLWNWMAGMVTVGSTYSLYIKNYAPYNSSGTNYTQINVSPSGGSLGSWQYPTAYTPYQNGAIVLPKTVQSDSTKGWPDGFYVDSNAGFVPYVGGMWGSDLNYSGPWVVLCTNSPSNAYTFIGVRCVAA